MTSSWGVCFFSSGFFLADFSFCYCIYLYIIIRCVGTWNTVTHEKHADGFYVQTLTRCMSRMTMSYRICFLIVDLDNGYITYSFLFYLYWSVIEIIKRYSSRTMPPVTRISGFRDRLVLWTWGVWVYMHAWMSCWLSGVFFLCMYIYRICFIFY